MTISNGSAQLPQRPVRIRSIKDNEEHIVRFLGPYHGQMMHHVPKNPQWPCQGAACPISMHRHRLIWKGFGPAEEWVRELGAWYLCVIEITEALDETLRGFELRGQVWHFSHPRPGEKQTPVIGMFLEQSDVEFIRPAFDIRPILDRCYRGAVMTLDAANPVPAKVMSSAELGGGPRVLEFEAKDAPKPATEEQWKQLRKMIGKDDSTGRDSQPAGSRPINGKGVHDGR